MAEKNFNEIVQNAIDSQDFNALSNSIHDLVTNTITDALGEIGDNVNMAADIIAGRVKPIDRRPEYMKNPVHTVEAPQNPWRGNGQFEAKSMNHFRANDIMQQGIFSNGGLSRVKGYLFMVFGIAGLMGSLGGLLSLLIANAFIHLSSTPAEVILFILSVLFGVMTARGYSILSKIGRFKKYIKTIGKKCFVSIKELAGSVGKSEKDTLKDVSKMIDNNMFLQGHLDAEKKNLYVTDEAYSMYQEELEKYREQVQEQEIQRILNFEKEQKEMLAKEAANAAIPEEVRKLLQTGDGYIDLIKRNNEAIADENVSAKLDDLEGMTAQIFGFVKEHPESADETKKLMKYYLPTTIKLLDSYQKLTEAEESGLHPDQVKNIQRSKKEIEETLDTLNQAFARLFDNLYQDTSMDISADISVLNTLLAQEGLVGEELKSKEVAKNQGQVLQSH